MFKNMNNKTTIFIAVGITVLSLLAMKPLTNQVFAQTNETQTNAANQQTGNVCTSELSILAHSTLLDRSGAIGVPKGQTAPMTFHGELTCGGEALGGHPVHVSIPANCGSAAAADITTESNGAFNTREFNLGPCPTPYSAQAQFPGDNDLPVRHDPATASTGFFIDETK
jgi:hypothetical protein